MVGVRIEAPGRKMVAGIDVCRNLLQRATASRSLMDSSFEIEPSCNLKKLVSVFPKPKTASAASVSVSRSIRKWGAGYLIERG